MTSDSNPDSQSEQAAKHLQQAVEQAVQDWLEDNSSSAHRDGEFVCIREDELVEKLLVMNALTALELSDEL